MRKTLLGALAVGTLLVTLGAAGCSSGGADLSGKPWVLKSYGDADNPTAVIAGTEVTAEFSDGEVGGSAGCNHYFGSYEVDGEKLTFGPLASTEMWCEEPEGRMDQEYSYLQALGKAGQYEIKDGELIITGTDDQVVTFAEKFGAELEGKTWVLESYGDPDNPTAVIVDTRVTAEFAAGQVNGSAGCNRYFGSYEAGQETIAFGPTGSTMMECGEPEGRMDQEYSYLQALGEAEEYEVKDGKLLITYADGQVLTFSEE